MQTMADAWREEGYRKGFQEALLETTRSLLVRQLRRRFGELPGSVLARIDAADLADLERWSEEILDARSLDALFPAP